MATTIWAITDKWMRTLHLYTGLFLAPWMIIYALSAFHLNHFIPITDEFDTEHPPYRFIVAKSFRPAEEFLTSRQERAKIVLDYVDMNGPFRIDDDADPLHFTIDRPSGSGSYRVTYHPQDYRIRIEKQDPFSIMQFIDFLHFRNSYNFASFPYTLWAIVIDLAAFSMILWVLSGIYLWARMPHKRLWGSVSLVVGAALFATLVVAMLG